MNDGYFVLKWLWFDFSDLVVMFVEEVVYVVFVCDVLIEVVW